MSNIFCLSAGLGDEDRFTASLNYLIDCNPDIGQDIVSLLGDSSGLDFGRFLKSTDHPAGTLEDKPDFLLECENIDIISEHKLFSPLGNRQLERYLSLSRTKSFCLALITNKYCQIPEEVISNPRYLKPNDRAVNHFTWQDIYPIISDRKDRLSRDFAEYMRSLEMKPWHPEAWENLFTDDVEGKSFGKQWVDVRAYFKGLGAKCTVDPSGRGFQISKPKSWLHLLYLSVSRGLPNPDKRVDGPYLQATIWINKSDTRIAKNLQKLDGAITSQGPCIFCRPLNQVASWDDNLLGVVEFSSSLDAYISKNLQELRNNLSAFSKTVFNHCNETLGNMYL